MRLGDSFFKRSGWVVLGTLLAATALLAWGQFSRAWVRAASDYPYLQDSDEPAILIPATSAYEGGYWAMRCREGHNGSCYGGAQGLLDALYLRALPQSWLERVETRTGRAYPWPWLEKYPNRAKALRVNRFFGACALLLLLGGAVCAYSRDRRLALLLPALLTLSPAFVHSWQGMKNDFQACLWLLGFLILTARIFAQGRRSRRLYFATLAVGAIGCFVKLTPAPAVALYIAYLPAFRALHHKESWRTALQDAAGMVVVCALVFVLLHPNLFASSLEAGWFYNFTRFKRHFVWRELFAELPWLVKTTWFLALPLALLLRDRARALQERWFLGYYALLLAGMTWTTVSSLYHRDYYYLPVGVIALFLAGLILSRARELNGFALRIAAGCVAAFLLLGTSATEIAAQAHWPEIGLADRLGPVVNAPESAGYDWWIDETLRAPLRVGAIPEPQLHFFDSQAQTPSEIAEAIRKRSGSLPVRVLPACWDPSSGDAPDAVLWGRALEKPCVRGEPVQKGWDVFKDPKRPNLWTVVDGPAFLAMARTVPRIGTLQGTVIEPRTLARSIEMQDHFGSKLLVHRAVSLGLDVIAAAGFEGIRVPLESSCKGPENQVEMSVAVGEGPWASKKVSLDVTPRFCADFPRTCHRPEIRRWSSRLYPAPEALEWAIRAKPGTRLRLRLDFKVSGCRVSLSEGQLLPGGT